MKIIYFLYPRYCPKIIADIVKNVQKLSMFLQMRQLMTMKLRMKLKNGSHRYDIDRPRPRHGQRYTEYKMCLIIMMVI